MVNLSLRNHPFLELCPSSNAFLSGVRVFLLFPLRTFVLDPPGRVLGRALLYGDPHASHSSFPHMEESDVFCLTSRLGPDTILAVLSCLLQVTCCVLWVWYMPGMLVCQGCSYVCFGWFCSYVCLCSVRLFVKYVRLLACLFACVCVCLLACLRDVCVSIVTK